ncbi:MAG: sigma-70 family RNA polymerase sigma factor [Bacteroidaceae bacterium]|nr:sigma-70 family RNA polymerase sigma factor [Bacteroidaceae bacterium]
MMKKSFLTEQDLALGCVRNDRDAQGELYARYSSRLYAICLRYIEDREEARDLMHDCMIKAMDNFKTFRYVSEGSLYAWLSRITVNMAINRLKESSRFRQIPFEQVSGDELENALEPDAESVRKIPDDVLDKLIAELPPVRRTVFNMYCIDGYSHHDIARALGITERTSTSVLAKARASLKKALMNYIDKTGL